MKKSTLPKKTTSSIAYPSEIERLTIALASQVERFLLGIDHSISIISHTPYEREGYPNMILMLNNWETLIGFLSRLRKCFDLAEMLPDYHIFAIIGKNTFDDLLPKLKDIRNVFEHFDNYLVGDGNNRSVDEIQAVSYGVSHSTFYFADMRVAISEIREATEVARTTFMTGDILSVLDNKRLSFFTLIQRQRYEGTS